MPQTPSIISLTPISQDQARIACGAIGKSLSPKFEEQKYRYHCGHCGVELLRGMEAMSNEAVFCCPDCGNFSRYDPLVR